MVAKLIKSAILILLITASLFLVSCSSLLSLFQTGYDLKSTTERAADLLGGEQSAVLTVLRASNNRYTPEQILKAIHNENISKTGEVESVSAEGKLLPEYPVTEKEVSDLFQAIPTRDRQDWTDQVFGLLASGYSTDQILTHMSRQLFYGEPELGQDETDSGNDAGSVVKPKRKNDWPFKDDKKSYAIRIKIRPGKRPSGTSPVPRRPNQGNVTPSRASSNNSPAGQSFSLKLTIDPESKNRYRMLKQSATLKINKVSNYVQPTGDFDITVQDLKNTSRVRQVQLKGTMQAKEDKHNASYPLRFGLHAKFTETVYLDGKRVSALDHNSPNAFVGQLTEKWGNGYLTAIPVRFDWEAEGLEYSGQDKVSPGRIDMSGGVQVQDDTDMRSKKIKKSKTHYAGQGMMTLDIIGFSKNRTRTQFYIYLHPNGSVTGKIVYSRLDIFSGRNVGSKQILLISGDHMLKRDLSGTLNISLENSKGKKFANALTGAYTYNAMSLSGMIKETNVITGETTFEASHLRRRPPATR